MTGSAHKHIYVGMSKSADKDGFRWTFSIVLPVNLHKQTKKAAIDAEVSLSAFVEEAIRVALKKETK